MIATRSLAIAASIAGALILSAVSGYKAASWRCQAKEQQFLNQLQSAEAKRDKKSYEAGLDFQRDLSNERIIYNEVEKIVERIVKVDHYRGSCFDDAGLRVIDAAISGRIPTEGSSDALPRPNKTD